MNEAPINTDKLLVRDDVTLIGRASMSFSICVSTDTENWKYAPKEDITALELANLMEMFVCLNSAGRGMFGPYYHYDDIINFIRERKVERHFDITPK